MTDLTAAPAGHPALELLNTRVGLHTDAPVERIPDGRALIDWMLATGLVAEADVAQMRLSGAALDAVAVRVRALREKFRPVVAAWAAGRRSGQSRALVAELNRLMAAAPQLTQLVVVDGRFAARHARRLTNARALLAPIADACMRLLVEADHALVRECEGTGCSLWFYDRTRSHRRRWCSMAVCGTRAKVAAYRARRA